MSKRDLLKCIYGGKEHNFNPRYDEEPNPKYAGGEEFSFITADKIREMMIIRVYVKDICEWCGKTISRNE